jgi:hypothetical protein
MQGLDDDMLSRCAAYLLSTVPRSYFVSILRHNVKKGSARITSDAEKKAQMDHRRKKLAEKMVRSIYHNNSHTVCNMTNR